MDMKAKKNMQLDSSILRFIFVGGICTGIQYIILIVLVNWTAFSVVLASGFGFSISTLVNYFLSRSFTFRSNVPHRMAFPKFISVAVTGLLSNTVLMMLFYGLLGIYYLLSQIITTGLVMIMNYLVNRYWSFAHSSASVSS